MEQRIVQLIWRQFALGLCEKFTMSVLLKNIWHIFGAVNRVSWTVSLSMSGREKGTRIDSKYLLELSDEFQD